MLDEKYKGDETREGGGYKRKREGGRGEGSAELARESWGPTPLFTGNVIEKC